MNCQLRPDEPFCLRLPSTFGRHDFQQYDPEGSADETARHSGPARLQPTAITGPFTMGIFHPDAVVQTYIVVIIQLFSDRRFWERRRPGRIGGVGLAVCRAAGQKMSLTELTGLQDTWLT